MESIGIGTITGLYGISDITNAVIVDSQSVFESIRRGAEKITSVREGATGFRSVAVRQGDVDFVVVQIPPYPAAMVEAVSELYYFGIRNIVSISRGYRFSKKVPLNSVLIAAGGIGRDSLSSEIAGVGVPLLASQRLIGLFKSIVEQRFSDFEWAFGFTVSVESPRIRWCMQKLRELAGKRGVYAVDTVTATLYALQYEYQNLEALSLLTLSRHFSFSESMIISSLDEHQTLEERETREESILYLATVEFFKSLGVRR